MFDHENYDEVPDRTLNALDRWAKDADPRPGDFIMSVLENDLDGAVAHADGDNQKVLYRIMMYVWNELPGGCWGSPEKVEAWDGLSEKTKERVL